MSGQFGSFDGLDNRKTIVDCFVRFGKGLSFAEAAAKRAGFIQALIDTLSTNGFAGKDIKVDPCSAAEAYILLVASCTALGVNIEWAAKILEDVARQDEELRKAPQESFVLPESGQVLARKSLERK